MKKHFIKLLFSFSICLTFLQANAQFPVKWNITSNVLSTTNSMQLSSFGLGGGVSTNYLPACQNGFFDFTVNLNNGYVRVGFSDVSSSWSTNDMFYLQWDPGTGIVELRNK